MPPLGGQGCKFAKPDRSARLQPRQACYIRANPIALVDSMVKIDGLDTFTRQLDEAQKALASIDGDLGEVRFSPDDPASIERAIQDVEAMIDERLSAYATNPIVGPLAEEMKEQYREAIVARAAEARSAGDSTT